MFKGFIAFAFIIAMIALWYVTGHAYLLTLASIVFAVWTWTFYARHGRIRTDIVDGLAKFGKRADGAWYTPEQIKDFAMKARLLHEYGTIDVGDRIKAASRPDKVLGVLQSLVKARLVEEMVSGYAEKERRVYRLASAA